MRPNPTNFSFDQVGNPLNLNQSFQEVSTVANHLRHIVRSQQVLIDALTTKQQQTEQKLEYFLGRQERISEYYRQREYYAVNSVEPDDSIEHYKQEHDSEEERPQIMRRNGFKSPSSDNERSVSEKSKKQKRIPSKAKHLWINYGKRIVDYAIENTKGVMQDRVRKLVGKLNTKREYKKLFGIKVNDSDEERQFKIELGTLAIDFVKNKSAKAFDGARHKDEMIAQWNAVATYIENLISESI